MKKNILIIFVLGLFASKLNAQIPAKPLLRLTNQTHPKSGIGCTIDNYPELSIDKAELKDDFSQLYFKREGRHFFFQNQGTQYIKVVIYDLEGRHETILSLGEAAKFTPKMGESISIYFLDDYGKFDRASNLFRFTQE